MSPWLFGNGEDCDFVDGEWGKYMQDNQILTAFIINTVEDYTSDMAPGSKKQINITTSAVIENGESIIGYEYLHGTNADVGGFKISGTVGRDFTGNIGYNIRCTWNDKIDPNPIYATDVKKAAFAQHIPFVKPTDYRISISWQMKSSNYPLFWGSEWKPYTITK